MGEQKNFRGGSTLYGKFIFSRDDIIFNGDGLTKIIMIYQLVYMILATVKRILQFDWLRAF